MEETGGREDWAWREELNRNRKAGRNSASQTQELGLSLRRGQSDMFHAPMTFFIKEKSEK